MTAVRFTTTRLSGLRVAGRLQELQHATLAPFLERELGPDYGRLFADFEAESSDVRAWYTEGARPPRSIAALPDAEAEALRQRVADMIGQVSDFAARIAGESTQKANLARILTAATTFPVEDIWADGTQPIIVNWGFHRHDVEPGVPSPIRDRIKRKRAGAAKGTAAAAAPAVAVPVAPPAAPPAVPAAAVPAAVPPAAPAAHWAAHAGPTEAGAAAMVPAMLPDPALHRAAPARWTGYVLPTLLWLAFLLLAGTSYRLLLPACEVAGLSWLGACPIPADDARVFTEGVELQALVEAAELEETRRQALCRAPRRAEGRRAGGAAGRLFADHSLAEP